LNETSVSIPGKLYLCGEYAVTDGGFAVVLPVNREMRITVKNADAFKLFTDKKQEGIPFTIGLKDLTRYPLVKNAITTVIEYTKNKGISIRPVEITIASFLEDDNHKALGLGSSGALTTGIIEAMLRHLDIHVTPMTLYILAVKTQAELAEVSSFGDLALSAYKNPILYRPFHGNPKEPDGWKDLVIERLNIQLPPYTIINTREKTASTKLVSQVNAHKHKTCYQTFKTTSARLVEALLKAIQGKATIDFIQTIDALNTNFINLEQCTNTPLFNRMMHRLNALAKENGGAMKFSGAGGGDNVLLFYPDDKTRNTVETALKTSGFKTDVIRFMEVNHEPKR